MRHDAVRHFLTSPYCSQIRLSGRPALSRIWILPTIGIRMRSGISTVGVLIRRSIERSFGCGGPIRTEYSIIEHTVPQRIDSLRGVSLMFASVKQSTGCVRVGFKKEQALRRRVL
jgi:hypothetical protein